jgi:DHA2 family methylenomycin A resistance protein-like MFS transporter
MTSTLTRRPAAATAMSRPWSATPGAGTVGDGDGRQPRAGWALAGAVLGNFMVILDAVVVNVALPSIRHDLGGGITGLQWVVDGYSLLFAAFLLSAGALSDRIGARRAFASGTAVFMVGSAACGLSSSLGMLVAARFVQGSAAAVMVPASMALIRHAFPDQARRARAVAMWAVGGALAASSGPVLGGVLTLVSWRAIFFVNVPVAALTLALLVRSGRSPRRPVPLDWVGQITAVAAMGGVTYGAIEVGAHGFAAPAVIAAFAVGLVGVAGFVMSQAKGAHSMVPLGLFRSRNVSVGTAVGFAFMVGYYGLPFIMSLYLQTQRGLSALMTGVAFLPMMLSGAALTAFSARLTELVGARRLISGGLVVMAGGLGLLAVVPLSLPVWHRPADDPRWGHRPPDHAARHRRAARQRPGPSGGHGQRRVQHQPPDWRRPGHSRLRSPSDPAGRLHPRRSGQSAARCCGRPGRSRHCAVPSPPAPHEPAAVPPSISPVLNTRRRSMSEWTPQDLARIDSASEIDIAPLRPDGTMRPSTTIWIVRVSDSLYVRSYRGRDGSWYRALQSRQGRIRVGVVEGDVTLQDDPSVDPAALDEAYRTKYGRSPYADAMSTDATAATTLRVVPR